MPSGQTQTQTPTPTPTLTPTLAPQCRQVSELRDKPAINSLSRKMIKHSGRKPIAERSQEYVARIKAKQERAREELAKKEVRVGDGVCALLKWYVFGFEFGFSVSVVMSK